MLAKQDNAIKTAAFFMESYAEDSPEMQQYLYDRQRAINREKALKRQEEERERAFQEQERALREQKETIEKLSVENMHLREEIEELKKRTKGLRK